MESSKNLVETSNDANSIAMVQSQPELEQSDFCSTLRRPNSLPYCGSSCTPICPEEELKPSVGMVFESLERAEEFYKAYAHYVGFSVRVGQCTKNEEGIVLWRRYVCSKEGFKTDKAEIFGKGKEVLGKEKKNTKLSRCECEAKISLKRIDDGNYKIYMFVESHTHVLVSPTKKQFIRSHREVSSMVKNELFNCYRANIGTSAAWRKLGVERGGFENIGCTKKDLQNYEREFRCAIDSSGGQMFIDILECRRLANPSFFYECELDSKGRIVNVFWADSTAMKNYVIFGDVVSFNATYETNQYKMIFTRFTGVNHHRSSVSFGAAFLANERIVSYTWLFKTFLKAMGGKQPTIIVTDEDPSMKVAIADVFTYAKHRYCMWHIMKKLPEKMGSLNSNRNFIKKFNKCVWGSETTSGFEESWCSILDMFGLQEHEWLADKYAMRSDWIPAYFKDVPLGGMLRTTQRSESANSYFRHFISKRLPLVHFWNQFENVMDTQRYQEELADNNTLYKMPQLKSTWNMESHARDIFTHEIFSIFQEELIAARDECIVRSIAHLDEVTVQGILEKRTEKLREVRYDTTCKVAQCYCKKFESEGIPCRHIICVLHGALLDELPDYFLLDRWTKTASKKEALDVDGNIIKDGLLDPTDSMLKKMSSDTRRKFDAAMQVAEGDVKKMEYLQKIIFEAFLGCIIPLQIDIHPPSEVRTKGSGKRLKGGLEKAIEKNNRAPRLCRVCNERGFHDARNCPSKHGD